MRFLALCVAAALSTSAMAKAPFNYVFDDSALKKHPKIATELQTLRDEGSKQAAPRESLKRTFDLLETLSQAEPAWIDGYWMLGEAAFQYANSLTDQRDRELARSILAKGQAATETCLKKAPDNAPCKMFLGAALGKIASINGVFSSLKNAETIEKLWLDVLKSEINHRLSESNSLRGAAFYALGIFYRLVPNSQTLKWMFGTKGDIAKSMAMHQASIDEDGPNACSLMMLGLAQLCSVNGDAKSTLGKTAMANLEQAKVLPSNSALAKTCVKDIPKIEKDPDLACGYEASGQQEEKSDEDLTRLKAPK